MCKEWFMAAHDELIEEYLAEHPDADWYAAYQATSDMIDARYYDKAASMVDGARDRAKYKGL
jgi:hypothetical protein